MAATRAAATYKLISYPGPEYREFHTWGLLDDANALSFPIPRSVLKESALGFSDYKDNVMAQANKRGQHFFMEMYRRMREALPNVKLICLIEPVPDSNFLLAGHRIWFYDAYQINRPADALEDGIIADCEWRRQADENAYYAKSARVSIGGRTYLYHDLTLEKYLDTCNALLPGQLISSNPNCRDYPLRSRMNPANPDAIFDMDHAMVGIPEAHPLWCDKSNYIQKWRDPVLGSLHRRYRMPYDKRFPVVRLTLDQTNLNVADCVFTNLFFPHVKATMDTTSLSDQRVFWESIRRREETMEDIEELDDGKNPLPKRNIYDTPVSDPRAFEFAVSNKINPDVQWDIDRLAANNKKRFADLQARRDRMIYEGKVPLDQILKDVAKERHEIWMQGISEFKVAVWNENANVSEELKLSIRWGEQYLATNKNFSRPQSRLTSNLSTSAECDARLLMLADKVLMVYVNHHYLRTILLAQNNAYRMERPGIRLNITQTGPPGKGKSVLMRISKDMAIPGSVVENNYETAKAKTGTKPLPNGKRTIDGFIVHRHEASNDELGIGMSGKNPSGAAAEAINFRKATEDSSRFIAKRPRRDLDTNEFVTDTIPIECAGSSLENSNWTADQFDPAIRARRLILPWTAAQSRCDGKEMMDFQRVTRNIELDRLRERLYLNYHVNQHLRSLCGQLQYIHLLPNVHQITNTAMEIYSQIVKAARKYGLKKDIDSRTTDRVRDLCLEQAYETVFHHLFHGEASSFRSTKWDMAQLEYGVPILRASVQHALLAIEDVRETELEDHDQYLLLDAIESHRFTPKSEGVVKGDSKDASDDPELLKEKKREKLSEFYYAGNQLVAMEMAGLPTNYVERRGDKNVDYVYYSDMFTSRQPLMAVTSAPKSSIPGGESKEERPSDPSSDPSVETRNNERRYERTLNDDEKFEKMARFFRTHIRDKKDRPSVPSLVKRLKAMNKDQTVEASNGSEIPMLQFVENGFVIATTALLNNIPNPIERATLEVLQHRGTIDGQVYTTSPGHKGHPHLRNVIKVKRNDKVHFKTQNVNYLGPKERSVLQDQFPDELVDPEAMNKIYKQTKFDHLDANTTLEQRDFEAHLMATMWHPSELEGLNLGTETLMDERHRAAALKRRKGQPLPSYPEGLYDEDEKKPKETGSRPTPMDVDSQSSSSSSSSCSSRSSMSLEEA